MKYLVETKKPLYSGDILNDNILRQKLTVLAEISETDFSESINELESLVKVYQNDIDMKYLIESAIPKVQKQINNLQSAINILKKLST